MITTTEHAAAPPDRVWRHAADLDRWAEMLPTMESVDRVDGSGAPGVGARYRVRLSGLRVPPAVYEVTEWRPGQAFTWVARTTGVTTTATHEVVPDGDGTTIRLGMEWTGPMAWLVRRAIGRKAQEMVDTEARTFARLAEQG